MYITENSAILYLYRLKDQVCLKNDIYLFKPGEYYSLYYMILELEKLYQ